MCIFSLKFIQFLRTISIQQIVNNKVKTHFFYLRITQLGQLSYYKPRAKTARTGSACRAPESTDCTPAPSDT